MRDNVIKLKDTSTMVNLTVLMTSKCTLKCKLCATYASYHPNPSNYSYEVLTKSVTRFFDSVTSPIGIITISGGEPLLHPQLPEFIEYLKQYENRVEMIEIITNATIVPNVRLIKALKTCNKLNLLVDNYGVNLSTKLEDLLKKLDENEIAYRLRNYTKEDSWCGGWIDVSDFSSKNRKNEEIENIFSRCAFNNIYNNIYFLINGRIHMCYVIKESLPSVEEMPEESVDLLDIKLTNTQISKQMEQLRNRKYLRACKNCNGYLTDSDHITPAEQM